MCRYLMVLDGAGFVCIILKMRHAYELACCAICGATLIAIVASPVLLWSLWTGVRCLSLNYP